MIQHDGTQNCDTKQMTLNMTIGKIKQMTLDIITINIVTLSVMIFSITEFSIMTLSTMTLSIRYSVRWQSAEHSAHHHSA
jgi:hypothetical protein